ncbi:hypothetical protein QUF72_17890 [Desulfobacterales bacterium HSG2]|nr:hypothetical protein [Desulfobacterales bacterium HSG2]
MMNYDIVFGPSFKRGIRKLKKRFPSVKKDIALAVDILLENLELGVLIPGGSDVRKLRVRNSDIKRGKSGGYRLLYHFDDEAGSISLLLLYAKSNRENITSGEIRKLLEELSKASE